MIKRALSLTTVFILTAVLFLTSCSGNGNIDASSQEIASTGDSVTNNEGGGTQTDTPGNAEPIRAIIAQGGLSRSVEKAVEKYQKETGASVELMIYPYQEAREKMVLELRSSTGLIDMIQVDGPIWMAEMKSYLDPLEQYVERDNLDTGIYVPEMLEMSKGDGTLYTLPYRIGAYVLIYRKDLFDAKGLQPPKTMDDFLSCATALTDGDVYGFTATMKQTNYLAAQWFPFLYSFGGSILNDDMTQAAFNTEQGVKALTFMIDLMRTHKVVPPAAIEYEQDGVISSMQQGIAAMCIAYSPYYLEMNDPEKSEYAGNFAVSPVIPYDVDSGLTQGITEITGWGFGISKDSKNKDATWELIKYVTSEDTQIYLACEASNSPTVKSAFESAEYLAKFPDAQYVVDAMLGAKSRPGVIQWSSVEDVLAREISSTLNEVKTIEQALSDAEAEVNALLKS